MAAIKRRGAGPLDNQSGKEWFRQIQEAVSQQIYYVATHPEASLVSHDKARAAIAVLFALEPMVEFPLTTYEDTVSVLARLMQHPQWLAQWRHEDAVLEDLNRHIDKAERERDRRLTGKPERAFPTAWDRIRR
jgi:hypothetical protein